MTTDACTLCQGVFNGNVLTMMPSAAVVDVEM